jgi:hypothetical protein
MRFMIPALRDDRPVARPEVSGFAGFKIVTTVEREVS